MFEHALDIILGFEGGYSHDPNDPGGATNYGITQQVYNDYHNSIGLPEQSVRGISHEEVVDIYRRNYWIDSGCNKIELIDPYLALVHFNGAVNTGTGQAARILQRCVGATPDGSIGPVSLEKIKACVAQDKYAIRVSLLAGYMDFYLDLVLARFALRQFLPSWMRRIQKLLEKMPTYA